LIFGFPVRKEEDIMLGLVEPFVAEAVKEHGCSENDISLKDIEYPEEIL
jgi:hypothetical protein